MMKILQSISLLFILILTACNKSSHSTKYMSPLALLKDVPAHHIKIVGPKLENISGAQVLIGQKLLPDGSNFLQADENGEFAIPDTWTKADTITIDAPGYIRASFVDREPKEQVLQINAKDKTSFMQNGATSGFGTLKSDGKVDFAILLPLFTRGNYLQFNVAMFLSNQYEEMNLGFGQSVFVPANLSFPDQKERYGLVNIRFNKPNFTLQYPEVGTTDVIALRGQFPMDPVAGDMRNGKSFFELINYFDFQGGALREYDLPSSSPLNIAVKELSFQSTYTVNAPPLSAEQKYYVVNLQNQNSFFYPTDLKRLGANEKANIKINVLNPETTVLTVIGKEEKTPEGVVKLAPEMSVAAEAYSLNFLQKHLGLVPPPSIEGEHLLLQVPTANDIFVAGTYLVLSDVSIVSSSERYQESRQRRWEVFASQWLDHLDLPTWPTALSANTDVQRWEVIYLGAGLPQNSPPLGPQMIESANYASRNSVDF